MSRPDNVVVQIDQAKFNWSIINKYDINASEGIYFEWAQLSTKDIATQDIELLIQFCYGENSNLKNILAR